MPLISTILAHVSTATPNSQSNPRYVPPSAIQQTAIWVALLVALVSPPTWATPANEAAPGVDDAEPEAFGAYTPLGRLSYRAGRGLRVGKTGLLLGGFATAGAEFLEGDEKRGRVEELNFLLSFDPVPFLHLFTELGVERLAALERGQKGVRSDPTLGVKRLYLDLPVSDPLSLRFGKFLTPIGRWNLVAREPLLWTTSDPLIVGEIFDETATGAMLYGSVFPRGRALSYSLYGTFLDPIDVDPDELPAERSAGARLEWASPWGWMLGASYLASQFRKDSLAIEDDDTTVGAGDREWNHLGGADFLWQPHERVEVSGEAVFGEGSREDGTLWGLYVQTVVETVRTLYVVGRYERFDPPGAERAVDLFDLGLAWVPIPYLRLKADYVIADHLNERSSPGLRMSVSILF